MKKTLNNITENDEEKIITDETRSLMKEEFEAVVENRLQERLQLEIDDIDKNHASELQELVESIDEKVSMQTEELLKKQDNDHGQKLKSLIENLDRSYSEKLKLVRDHYEDKQNQELNDFKEIMLENISDFIDKKINDQIPADVFHRAAQRYVNPKNTTVRESTKAPAKAVSILESLTKGFSSEKKKFVESKLQDKENSYVKNNFDYVVNMFEKRKQRQQLIIAESAKRQSIHSIDSNQVMLNENDEEFSSQPNDIDPLMQSYINRCIM